jgi:hypothetical protein
MTGINMWRLLRSFPYVRALAGLESVTAQLRPPGLTKKHTKREMSLLLGSHVMTTGSLWVPVPITPASAPRGTAVRPQSGGKRFQTR